MRGNIRHGKIVGVKEIAEAGGPHPDQNADGEARIASGLNQQWMAGDDRCDASDNRINREGKRQKQRVRAEYIQFNSSIPAGSKAVADKLKIPDRQFNRFLRAASCCLNFGALALAP